MNLKSTVSELLETIVMGQPGDCLPGLAADLAVFLVHQDCDFYEVMRFLLSQKITSSSTDDARKLFQIVPKHRKLKSLAPHDIHGMIARWTSTRYHSGPIQQIVRDIQLKCQERQVGLYVYNSNLNPNNPKSANDPYLLLITEEGMAFSDLNRKISYHYEMGGKMNV